MADDKEAMVKELVRIATKVLLLENGKEETFVFSDRTIKIRRIE